MVTARIRASHPPAVQLYTVWRCTERAPRCSCAAGSVWSPGTCCTRALAEQTGLSIGVVSIIVGAVVLLLWIPMRDSARASARSPTSSSSASRWTRTLALVPDAHGLGAAASRCCSRASC